MEAGCLRLAARAELPAKDTWRQPDSQVALALPAHHLQHPSSQGSTTDQVPPLVGRSGGRQGGGSRLVSSTTHILGWDSNNRVGQKPMVVVAVTILDRPKHCDCWLLSPAVNCYCSEYYSSIMMLEAGGSGLC